MALSRAKLKSPEFNNKVQHLRETEGKEAYESSRIKMFKLKNEEHRLVKDNPHPSTANYLSTGRQSSS